MYIRDPKKFLCKLWRDLEIRAETVIHSYTEACTFFCNDVIQFSSLFHTAKKQLVTFAMSGHFECVFKIKLYIITNSTITYHENLIILCLQELHNDRVFPPVRERCHSRTNVENLKQGSIDSISISFREKKNSERQQFSQMLHFVCLLVFLNAAGRGVNANNHIWFVCRTDNDCSFFLGDGYWHSKRYEKCTLFRSPLIHLIFEQN